MNLGIKPLTAFEMGECRRALSRDDFPSGLSYPEKAPEVVKEVIGAFYRARFGVAPGTAAVRAVNGQTAMRFYDEVEKKYRWSVNPPPVTSGSGAQIVRCDDLPGKAEEWTVHERSWTELVYPSLTGA